MINYLFFEVGVHRVEIHHATDNPASGRVAEKCGLTCEGVLRSRSKTGTGEFKDIRVWGILRDEWKTED
ncbi:MAG: GNAT family N-acetyltransferase [Clostridia bacterium]|nr:GNAT family N-acetyltransferase [Clostridia bacterium]